MNVGVVAAANILHLNCCIFSHFSSSLWHCCVGEYIMIGKQTLKSEFRVVSGDAGVLLSAYSAVCSFWILSDQQVQHFWQIWKCCFTLASLCRLRLGCYGCFCCASWRSLGSWYHSVSFLSLCLQHSPCLHSSTGSSTTYFTKKSVLLLDLTTVTHGQCWPGLHQPYQCCCKKPGFHQMYSRSFFFMQTGKAALTDCLSQLTLPSRWHLQSRCLTWNQVCPRCHTGPVMLERLEEQEIPHAIHMFSQPPPTPWKLGTGAAQASVHGVSVIGVHWSQQLGIFNMSYCCRYHIKSVLRQHLREQGIIALWISSRTH